MLLQRVDDLSERLKLGVGVYGNFGLALDFGDSWAGRNLVDNTAMSNDHAAAPSADMFNELRRLTGRYGVRPSQLAFVTDVNTFIAAQAIDQLQTLTETVRLRIIS